LEILCISRTLGFLVAALSWLVETWQLSKQMHSSGIGLLWFACICFGLEFFGNETFSTNSPSSFLLAGFSNELLFGVLIEYDSSSQTEGSIVALSFDSESSSW
jgi:hypothetical protein